MKKDNGFTLIELMIVVAIIGIISAIAYPSYDSYLKKSRRADAKVGLAKLVDREERFYLQCGYYTAGLGPMLTDCALGSGIDASDVSDQGYYGFTFEASASGFTIKATAVSTKSQANDTGCTVMTIDSLGTKTPDGPEPGTKDCW